MRPQTVRDEVQDASRSYPAPDSAPPSSTPRSSAYSKRDSSDIRRRRILAILTGLKLYIVRRGRRPNMGSILQCAQYQVEEDGRKHKYWIRNAELLPCDSPLRNRRPARNTPGLGAVAQAGLQSFAAVNDSIWAANRRSSRRGLIPVRREITRSSTGKKFIAVRGRLHQPVVMQ